MAPSVTPAAGLPADVTSFVGRRQDVAAVKQLVATTRLVTLTGIGGVGKSRLALRVATEIHRAFPDGTYLVELGSLQDPALVVHAVIGSLAIGELSARDPVDVLCDHLRTRRALLLLDNCEHVVTAVTDLVHRVLQAAPGVSVIATSRHALRASGEYLYQITPLPAPPVGAVLARGTAHQYPAVTLFAERASAAAPGFQVTPENEAEVVRLCQRLEGIPLAIELAAVRLRVLTLSELNRRLDDLFGVLRVGRRDVPERHRTLEALIDWSYDLCDERERLLWARASVFAGGFTTDALEAVCADDSLPRADILEVVEGLLDKSIFVGEERGARIRFRMLEMVRSYGETRLIAAGERDLWDRRLRDWGLDLMETAGERWVGPEQQGWTQRLQQEHANLRRGFEYCTARPSEARAAMRMAAVFWYWFGVAQISEGRLWLDRALAMEAEPSRERAWALATAAYLAAFQGDPETMQNLSAEALTMAEDLDDVAAIAWALHVAGACRSLSGDTAGAISLQARALTLYDEAKVSPQYCDSLRAELATTHLLTGDIDTASTMVDELYEEVTASGDAWILSWVHWAKGLVAMDRGHLEEAEASLVEGLRIQRQFADALGLAMNLEAMGWTTVALGDPRRGATLLGAANSRWSEVGERHSGWPYLVAQRKHFEQEARAVAGDDAFESAVGDGERLSAGEAVSFALREHAAPEAEAPGAPAPALTRRQREVAELIAEGMSNKEIAAKLVVSLRTAEGHVQAILTALDLKSRAQIAAWFIREHSDQR